MSLYDHVEAGDYTQAHALSLCLLVFSFAALLVMSLLRPRRWANV
jgi:molybdate transport system permease protein